MRGQGGKNLAGCAIRLTTVDESKKYIYNNLITRGFRLLFPLKKKKDKKKTIILN